MKRNYTRIFSKNVKKFNKIKTTNNLAAKKKLKKPLNSFQALNKLLKNK